MSGKPVALYWVSARPTNPGTTGSRAFHSMNDDKIAEEPADAPTVSDRREGDK